MESLPSRVRPIFKQLASGVTRLKWESPPRNIFVAKKDGDKRALDATRGFLNHLHQSYPVNLLTRPHNQSELDLPYVLSADTASLKDVIDLVITLGGDGTILRATSLFKEQSLGTPPVLSFSMGTLGFLLPFDYSDATSAFEKVYEGRGLVMPRSRVAVTLPNGKVWHAMNDVTIHRGSSPHLTQLNIAVNGQPVTTAIADGITVSTPTGSTAYSLSAGGSIVHPAVKSILLTPICPRSLSFRPLIFPEAAEITISVSNESRAPPEISLDGLEGGTLNRGESITVRVNPNECVWCVSQGSDTDDWVRHLNGLLGFNSKFGLAPPSSDSSSS